MDDRTREIEHLYDLHLRAIQRRFEQALATCGYDAVLVHSGSPPYIFRDDQPYPFKVNATFKSWVPLTDVPDCFVYHEPGRRPVLFLHQPADYWHKPADRPDSYWTAHFDIWPVENRDAVRNHLSARTKNIAFIGEAFAELASWELTATNPHPLLDELEYHRAVKSPYELACMREASRLGARGHMAALSAFEAGQSEFGIQLAFLEACGLREQELPYNPIIALNESGAMR